MVWYLVEIHIVALFLNSNVSKDFSWLGVALSAVEKMENGVKTNQTVVVSVSIFMFQNLPIASFDFPFSITLCEILYYLWDFFISLEFLLKIICMTLMDDDDDDGDDNDDDEADDNW